MTQGPSNVIIGLAEQQARSSSCLKSKRGAVVYAPSSLTAYGRGFNGQPEGFACTGSAACRKACGMICEHAEARAIREAIAFRAAGAGWLADLVHVKIGSDGLLVAGGGPSCVQCSRLIVDVGFIGKVWLYEEHAGGGAPSWVRYTADSFHQITLADCYPEGFK